MRGIGGNKLAEIQTCSLTRNEIGERVKSWATVQTIRGWLDYVSGETGRQTYDAKVQDSSHVFVADYKPLAEGVRPDTARLLVDGQPYDVTLIDDPMELHYQWEIYLKRAESDVG